MNSHWASNNFQILHDTANIDLEKQGHSEGGEPLGHSQKVGGSNAGTSNLVGIYV